MRWPLARLSDVAEINPRRPPIDRTNDVLTSFVPMDAVDDICGEVVRLEAQPYRKVKRGYTHFEDGDVIFAKITPCMQNGKHAVVQGLIDGFGFGSTEFHVIRPSEQLVPEWIHLYLRRQETLDAALRTFAGTVGQQRVPASFLENLEVPLPTVEEQRCMASCVKEQLATVEAARRAANTQAKDISLLRIRLLYETLSTLDGVPTKVLGDHAPTTSGTTPARGDKRYWEPAEIPWVKTGEVAFAPISQTEEAVSRIALAECSLTLLPPKTVLVAMYGQGKTRGQSAMLEVAATTNQACLAILPNDTWEPEFLYYWLVASYQNLRDLSEDRGGNQANLNGALLKALEVPAPGRAQQLDVVRRIKAALHEMDVLAAAGRSTLIELELLPQRLLAQAFEY